MEPGTTDSGSVIADPHAFIQLLWSHASDVHAYLRRRVGRDAADDLFGEVWLQAFSSRETYDHRIPDARPWLYGVARNVLRTYCRRAGRQRWEVDAAITDPWPDVDERLDTETLRHRLMTALAALSYDEREVLLLVAWEHLTPAEAAIALAIPQGTIRSRLHRARSLMRLEFSSTENIDNKSCPGSGSLPVGGAT
jgi:RNA polymerase sigma-70 factor (ECF subfamily)